MSTDIPRPVGAAVLSCALALSLGGCGGGREYTVPAEVCGVPLSEEAIAPFLVDGRELRVLGDSLVDTGEETDGRCKVAVDDRLVVDLRLEKTEKFYDPMDESEEFRFTNRAGMGELPFGGAGAVGDFNTMVSTGCGAPGAAHLIVYVDVDRASTGDVGERRRNLERFALDFVPQVKKAAGCTR